jgi:hypothetical protein
VFHQRGAQVLGFNAMGASYAADASGPWTYDSTITYSIDASSFAPTDDLLVGLLDNTSSGTSTTSLQFGIQSNGTTLFDQSFTPTQASAFFDDLVLPPELLAPLLVGGVLDVSFSLDFSSADLAEFGTDFVFGVSGQQEPVPEPATALMFCTSAVGLLAMRRAFRGLKFVAH